MEAMVTEDTQKHGYDIDRENLSVLEVGKLYKVDGFSMGSWNSSVLLEGLDKWFNSVNFIYFMDGKEVDPHRLRGNYL